MDFGQRGPLSASVFKKIDTVLSPQHGPGGPIAGRCGSDGKQFCPKAWPEDLLGPISRASPFSTEIWRRQPESRISPFVGTSVKGSQVVRPVMKRMHAIALFQMSRMRD